MSVEGLGARRTEELADEWAHDAGIIEEGRHVKARAQTPGGAALHAGRNGTDWDGAVTTGKAVGGAVNDTLAGEIAEAVAPAAEGAGTVGGVIAFAVTALGELARAEAKADEIRAAYDNDAINVALASGLAFHPGFGQAELAARPGVEKAAGKLLEALAGKDAAMKPILQARADVGFLAAARAAKAVAHVPPQEQPAAILRYLQQAGMGTQLLNDAAFAKGVQYYLWCRSDGAKKLGVDVAAETEKIESRYVPPQPVRVAG